MSVCIHIFETIFSEFMNIYRNMPKEMLLISRTDNILRSINRELNAKVNRFSIMARCAPLFNKLG